MGGEKDGKPRFLVFETKGDHLAGNDAPEYKERLFTALEETFNAGKMTTHDGPARGVFRWSSTERDSPTQKRHPDG